MYSPANLETITYVNFLHLSRREFEQVIGKSQVCIILLGVFGHFPSFCELSFDEVLSYTKSNIDNIITHFASRSIPPCALEKFEILSNKGTYIFLGVRYDRVEKGKKKSELLKKGMWCRGIIPKGK